MQRRFIYLFFLALPAGGCKKSSLSTDAVMQNYTISTHTVPADGSSPVALSVELDNNTDADKRNVLFSASSGSFTGGKDSSISVKAVFVDGKLKAKAYYIPPMQPGKIYLSIQPDLSTYSNLRIIDSIDAVRSTPARVRLSVSSFSVLYGFLNEDTLTARLSNASGGNVSTGTRVIFYDTYLNGLPLNGHFRSVSGSSNASSQTSAIYTPGYAAPAGSSLWLKVSVPDDLGNPGPIRDSFLVTIIN